MTRRSRRSRIPGCRTKRKEVKGNAKYQSCLHKYVSPYASSQKAVSRVPQQFHQDTEKAELLRPLWRTRMLRGIKRTSRSGRSRGETGWGEIGRAIAAECSSAYNCQKLRSSWKSIMPLSDILSTSIPASAAAATGFSPPRSTMPTRFGPTAIWQTGSLVLPRA